MINLTAIFGQDAIIEYDNTGIIPSEDIEFADGSLKLQKEFTTAQGHDAYKQTIKI